MRGFTTAATAATLALLLAVPVVAQEIDCADIEFDAEIIANYPEVQEACLDVVEDQGVRYVHLRAKVLNNWISSLTIRYEHLHGDRQRQSDSGRRDPGRHGDEHLRARRPLGTGDGRRRDAGDDRTDVRPGRS